jgi:hypothetical protein
MRYVYDDGGRAAAGFKGYKANDCVTRAIAITTELPYQQVYDTLFKRTRQYAAQHRDIVANKIAVWGASPRIGAFPEVYRPYLESLGWTWTPTMRIGHGCEVHLTEGELPMGRLIVVVSRHVVAVIDGVIHDTHDPSRGGKRCVYGYYAPSH